LHNSSSPRHQAPAPGSPTIRSCRNCFAYPPDARQEHAEQITLGGGELAEARGIESVHLAVERLRQGTSQGRQIDVVDAAIVRVRAALDQIGPGQAVLTRR